MLCVPSHEQLSKSAPDLASWYSICTVCFSTYLGFPSLTSVHISLLEKYSPPPALSFL